MLIDVLACLGLLFIWIMNVVVFFGFGVIAKCSLENLVHNRDLSFAGWMRSLLDVILFCLALFFVAYVALVSMDLTKKYFQSRDTKVTIEMYLPSFEIEKK